MSLADPVHARLAATALREAADTRTRAATRGAAAVIRESDPGPSSIRLVTLLAQAASLHELADDLDSSADSTELHAQLSTPEAEAMLDESAAAFGAALAAAPVPPPGTTLAVLAVTEPDLTDEELADLDEDDPLAVAAGIARTAANLDEALTGAQS